MQTPLAFSVAEACEAANIGRTALYQAINSGKLRAVKRGSRTLILGDDLRGWIHNLPAIGMKHAKARSRRSSRNGRQR